MQAKLRKMAQWVWEKKERMVFAIMVLFLCWRVYQVVYPPEVPEIQGVATPSASGQMDVPPVPPGGPEGPGGLAPPTRPLTARNPFWYYASPDSGTGDEDGPSVPIVLMGFQELPKGTFARLQVGSDKRARSYSEGSQFQTFVLTVINADDKYVEVVDQSNNESYTIELIEE